MYFNMVVRLGDRVLYVYSASLQIVVTVYMFFYKKMFYTKMSLKKPKTLRKSPALYA